MEKILGSNKRAIGAKEIAFKKKNLESAIFDASNTVFS